MTLRRHLTSSFINVVFLACCSRNLKLCVKTTLKSTVYESWAPLLFLYIVLDNSCSDLLKHANINVNIAKTEFVQFLTCFEVNICHDLLYSSVWTLSLLAIIKTSRKSAELKVKYKWDSRHLRSIIHMLHMHMLSLLYSVLVRCVCVKH